MSRRNNQDRLNPSPLPAAPPPPMLDNDQSSPFSFVVPTELVDLPSGGKFYAQGHPLHGKETIEIRHMTAKEEDILTSETLLRKGIAIDRLLTSLLVDKTINLDDLLVGDKNALIVAARITGFGPHYETKITCPSCSDTSETTFDLHALEVHHPHMDESVSVGEAGTFYVVLPLLELTVEFKLMTGREERAFLTQAERRRKMKLPASGATDLLKSMIVSINDYTDAASIASVVDRLPLADSRYIRTKYEQVNPDLNMTLDFACVACSHEGGIAVPLTADFFWPKR